MKTFQKRFKYCKKIIFPDVNVDKVSVSFFLFFFFFFFCLLKPDSNPIATSQLIKLIDIPAELTYMFWWWGPKSQANDLWSFFYSGADLEL